MAQQPGTAEPRSQAVLRDHSDPRAESARVAKLVELPEHRFEHVLRQVLGEVVVDAVLLEVAHEPGS